MMMEKAVIPDFKPSETLDALNPLSLPRPKNATGFLL